MKRYQRANIYVSDFETLTPNSEEYKANGKTSVFLFLSREINNEEDVWGKTIEDFYKWCRDGKSKVVYFHNLSFDGNFIAKFLMKSKLKFMGLVDNQGEEQKLPKNSWRFFHNDNKIYSIEMKFANNKTTWTVKIKCSYNLLSSSVKALGKDFGMKKETYGDMTRDEFYSSGGLNMKPDIRNLFNEYIESDVEIVRLSLLSLMDGIEKIPFSTYEFKDEIRKINIHKELTIGGIVKKLSINYLKEKVRLKDKEFHWEDILDGYTISFEKYQLANKWKAGGFTQYNPDYQMKAKTKGDDYFKIKNGSGVDINSSYPYQASLILPYGELSLFKPEGNDKYEILEYYHFKIKSAIIKPNASPFITLKNWKKENGIKERYVKHLTNFECYYTKAEWDILNKSYDFVVEHQSIYYCKGATYFKEFIEILYNLKEQSKRDGLLAISQGYKILLNAFYGKNCARVDYQSSFYFKTEDYEQLKNDGVKTMRIGNKIHSLDTFRVREYATIEDNESINSDFSSVGYKIIKTTNIEKNYKDVNNVLIGGTIASYGRVQLQDAVYRIGWKNFIYCDTDSIYSTLTIKQVSKLLNMDDYKLGMWGIDAEFNGVRIMGAKRYVMQLTDHPNNKGNKTKFGYAGGSPDPNNYEEFIKHFEEGSEIFNAILRRKEDENGIILVLGDLRPKIGKN